MAAEAMVNAHETVGNNVKNNDSIKEAAKTDVISQPPSQSSCARLNINSHATSNRVQ